MLRVALARDEADETEDEREVKDKSETMDSGEDMVEMELASEDRRAGQKFCGDVDRVVAGKRSRCWAAALVTPTWAMAKPIALLLPRIWDAALAAGVHIPLDCGVNRGVGRRPSVGAILPGVAE